MTSKTPLSDTASPITKTSAASKPMTAHKPAPTAKPIRSKPPKLPKGVPALVYDLQGSMEIKVPAQWTVRMGKEAFKEHVVDLEARNVAMVSREARRVVYVHLPVTVRLQEQGQGKAEPA